MQPGHRAATEMRVVCSQEHRVAAENQGPKRFQKPERRVATEMRAVCSQERRVAAENQGPKRFQKPKCRVAAENQRAKEISEARSTE